VQVRPLPVVGSIRGRAVDALTGDPLAGDAVPFAQVELQSCQTEWGVYCYTVAQQDADAAGRFEFRQQYTGQLGEGTYRVRISADQYFTTDSEPFEVADEQHYDAGDVGVKSYPVRLTLEQGCGSIAATGGSCAFSVRVTNGGTAALKADTWMLVRALGLFYPGELTTFPLGTAKTVNLAPSASTTLAYTFTAPASLPGGATVCARAYASDKKNTFAAIGIHDVFCVRKGYDGFTVLTDEQKREVLKHEKE
jgi:5-hydroxyisourate hydrolase-like protein (transthyretin family)